MKEEKELREKEEKPIHIVSFTDGEGERHRIRCDSIEELEEISFTWGKAHKDLEKFERYRGRFLNYVVELEQDFDIIIMEALTSEEEKRELIQRVILKTERISIRNKFKIFKDLVEDLELLKEEDRKKIFRQIEKLINERNNLAHGIMMRGKGGKVYLRYYQRGKEGTEIILTDEYFERKFKGFRETFKVLMEIKRSVSKGKGTKK